MHPPLPRQPAHHPANEAAVAAALDQQRGLAGTDILDNDATVGAVGKAQLAACDGLDFFGRAHQHGRCSGRQLQDARGRRDGDRGDDQETGHNQRALGHIDVVRMRGSGHAASAWLSASARRVAVSIGTTRPPVCSDMQARAISVAT